MLTEETIYDFIKEGKVVIKVWSDKCPHCESIKKPFSDAVAQLPEYKFGEFQADYFDKSSIGFRDKYVKAETAPVILVFEDGKLRNSYYGVMNSDRLIVEFIKEGKRDNTVKYLEEYEKNKAAALNKDADKSKLYHLFAKKGEIIHNIETLQFNLNRVNQEIDAIKQPQKATA